MSIIEAKKYKAPRPSLLTVRMRTFLPWQMVRFLIVNLKMTVMILKSHGGVNEDSKSGPQ